MEERPYNMDDGVATCIHCGEPLKGREKVRYQGWWYHAECAAKSMEENVDNFDRRFFWLGSLGAPVGIFLTAALFVMSLNYEPILNPWSIVIPFLGMAAGLAFQSFGFYAIYANYKDTQGLRLAGLAIVSASFHALVAVFLLVYGFNPLYYDVSSDVLLPGLIPGYIVTLSLAYISLAFLMLMTAIVVMMLEGTLGSGLYNRILAVVFVGLTALAFSTPLSVFVELTMVTILFMSAGVPKQWREISHDE